MEQLENITRPNVVVIGMVGGRRYTTLNLCAKLVEDDEHGNAQWNCWSKTFTGDVTLTDMFRALLDANIIDDVSGMEIRGMAEATGSLEYGSIVSALVNARYSSDEMQSIVNNWMDGVDDGYSEMQAWRRYAKDVARGVMGTD